MAYSPEEQAMLREQLRKDYEEGGGLGESPDSQVDMVADDTTQAQNRFDSKMTDMTAANQAAANQGGELQKVGGAAAAGGMMTGNVALGGAGLAISTIGMIDDAKRKGEQAKIDAYNKKIMAQRQAVRNMFS